MAVPTILSVSPSSGHTGGGTLVEVLGTGFALPPPPAPSGPTTPPPPSVTVTFGGLPAARVEVVSPELLYCATPIADAGAAVAVSVQNNDAGGAPVPGELATRPAAYAFVRPDLSVDSDLVRAERALVVELDRQVFPNVHVVTSQDYDDATGDGLHYAFVQKLPALVLLGPEVIEDRIRTRAVPVEVQVSESRFVERRPPLVVDLAYTLVGVADNRLVFMNLMQAVRLFFQKNPRLRLDKVASAPEHGQVEGLELRFSFGQGAAVTYQGDDVQSFSGQVVLVGVPLEDIPGLPTAKPTGMPAHLGHESTGRFGWRTVEGEEAVDVQESEP